MKKTISIISIFAALALAQYAAGADTNQNTPVDNFKTRLAERDDRIYVQGFNSGLKIASGISFSLILAIHADDLLRYKTIHDLYLDVTNQWAKLAAGEDFDDWFDEQKWKAQEERKARDLAEQKRAESAWLTTATNFSNGYILTNIQIGQIYLGESFKSNYLSDQVCFFPKNGAKIVETQSSNPTNFLFFTNFTGTIQVEGRSNYFTVDDLQRLKIKKARR